MVILKYWGLMAIQLFSVAWGIMAGMAAIDLTLIGHIKGWRRIKYSKWLGGAIDEKRRYGYEIVSDQTTHPQVIWFLLGRLVPSGVNELSYRVAPLCKYGCFYAGFFQIV